MGENSKRESVFRFKRFSVRNRDSAMKVGTDGVLLGAWVDISHARNLLDVGAGTGLIALMAAQRSRQLSIIALELDETAAEEARQNVELSSWSDRISVVTADFLNYESSALFDAIVSNPPFFATTLKSPVEARALARHGGGLNVESLVARAATMLAPGGKLSFISPADRRDDVMMAAVLAGLDLSRLTMVYTKPTAAKPVRALWEFIKGGTKARISDLTLGSDEYIEMVSPFYLNM